jgi:hypothetical protein
VIGIVGHPDLTGATLKLLERELTARLAAPDPVHRTCVVRAGAGLPEAFARAARATGLPLLVVLPSRGALPVPLPEREAIAAGEMITGAERVRLLGFDPRDHGSCVTADERLIAGCRRLLAVWDGSWSTRRDATAHLVAYARGRGVPVEVLWPDRATRVGRPRPGGEHTVYAKGWSA